MREYGSEHPAVIMPDGYFKKLEKYNREIIYLRCGREALLYAALNIRQQYSPGLHKQPAILFPAYCCWSMVAPFEMAGWQIIYYRLNNDLTVDIGYLENLLAHHHPQAILTMNYYGAADTKPAVDSVKQFDSSIRVIEDFSHCTFSFDTIFNHDVDYYVSSIRKSIGIPDGAVIISIDKTDQTFIQPQCDNFVESRENAQTQKAKYFYNKNQTDKSGFLASLRENEHKLDRFDAIHSISPTSLDMLSQVNGDIISYARRENMKHLWSLVHNDITTVPGLERSFDGAPFSLPVLVDNRDEIQKRLAQKGLYTQLLWPISEKAQAVCPVSKYMNDKMLSVPVDQRYGWDDIEEIANILLTTI